MIICEIIVRLLVIVQNNKRCTVQGIKIKKSTSFVQKNPLIVSRFEPAVGASTRHCLPLCNSIDVADVPTRSDLPRIFEVITRLW